MAEPLIDPKIIANISKKHSGPGKVSIKSSRVIPAEKARINAGVVRIIGGDSDHFEQDTPPAIVLEKRNDNISKIIVKCPCGRHAELICEYDDEDESADMQAE